MSFYSVFKPLTTTYFNLHHWNWFYLLSNDFVFKLLPCEFWKGMVTEFRGQVIRLVGFGVEQKDEIRTHTCLQSYLKTLQTYSGKLQFFSNEFWLCNQRITAGVNQWHCFLWTWCGKTIRVCMYCTQRPWLEPLHDD